MRYALLGLLSSVVLASATGCASESSSNEATSQGALERLMIEDAPLPQTVAATVQQLNASCPDCGFEVAAYDVRSQGPIDMESAKQLLGPELGFQELDWSDRGAVDHAHLERELTKKALKDILVPLETELNGKSSAYPANFYNGQRMTAPDYCTGEQRYILLFEPTRKIVTLKFNDAHEC